VEEIPLGIRLTLIFVRLFSLAMIFPLIGSALLAFMALVSGMSSVPHPHPLAFSMVGLAAFLVVQAMIAGLAWLDSHLNQSQVPFASSWVATRPGHPARQLILPALVSIAFYGYIAALLWLFSHFVISDRKLSMAWLATWGSVAVVATFLHRYLKAKLPG